jgi:hypothetical protein
MDGGLNFFPRDEGSALLRQWLGLAHVMFSQSLVPERNLLLGLSRLYAALKRRSSTVLHTSCLSSVKSKIKVKGVGQECPTHTSLLGFRGFPQVYFL